MSTYSNRLQPALQNLLQRAVRFFHPRSSCTTMHISPDVQRITLNASVHDDLGWKNRTTRYILPRDWLYEWFSQFHRCGTYSVLSRSHSVVSGESVGRPETQVVGANGHMNSAWKIFGVTPQSWPNSNTTTANITPASSVPRKYQRTSLWWFVSPASVRISSLYLRCYAKVGYFCLCWKYVLANVCLISF